MTNFFDNGPPMGAWDALPSHQHQENVACAEEGPVVERLVDCSDDTILQTTFVVSTAANAPTATASTEHLLMMPDVEY